MRGTKPVADFGDPNCHVKVAGEFNGDGMSDILWQNSPGQATGWLMSGTNILSSAAIGPNPGSSWHLVGTGG